MCSAQSGVYIGSAGVSSCSSVVLLRKEGIFI